MIIHEDDAAKLSQLIGRMNNLVRSISATVALTGLAAAQRDLKGGLRELGKVIVALRGIRDRLELEPDVDEDVEDVGLVNIICADGAEPDEEHQRILDEVEGDADDLDGSLAALNAKLAACKRPARAEYIDEDEDEDEDRDPLGDEQ